MRRKTGGYHANIALCAEQFGSAYVQPQPPQSSRHATKGANFSERIGRGLAIYLHDISMALAVASARAKHRDNIRTRQSGWSVRADSSHCSRTGRRTRTLHHRASLKGRRLRAWGRAFAGLVRSARDRLANRADVPRAVARWRPCRRAVRERAHDGTYAQANRSTSACRSRAYERHRTLSDLSGQNACLSEGESNSYIPIHALIGSCSRQKLLRWPSISEFRC